MLILGFRFEAICIYSAHYSEPLRSVLCPITNPKTVILHILAYASHNDTMKAQLMSGHSLRPINECLYDSNEEHVLLALSTIANVALKTSSHRVRYFSCCAMYCSIAVVFRY